MHVYGESWYMSLGIVARVWRVVVYEPRHRRACMENCGIWQRTHDRLVRKGDYTINGSRKLTFPYSKKKKNKVCILHWISLLGLP